MQTLGLGASRPARSVVAAALGCVSLLGLSPEITSVAVKRQGYGAQPLTPAVVEAQQKIADTFTELRLIPKKLSIKDVIWTPPAGAPAKVAQQ